MLQISKLLFFHLNIPSIPHWLYSFISVAMVAPSPQTLRGVEGVIGGLGGAVMRAVGGTLR